MRVLAGTCGGSRLCCSGSERRRIQSGATPRICVLVLGVSEIIHRNNISLHRKHSSVSHVSQSRAEPVSAGDLGAARDAAGVRDGSVGSVPKAERLGCELR